jgi:maleylacetate reductase
METSLDSREARSTAQYGAWLSGICLGSAGMALHHKLCHVLGGMFDLPHAELHAVLLPHVLSFNLAETPQAATALCEALNCSDPARCLYKLGEAGGLGGGLKSLGMAEAGIEAAADAALVTQY